MTGAANIIDVTDGTFEFEVIQRSFELPVVVDFWAPWCSPCRVLGPILERLAEDPTYDFVLAKVNVDDNPAISRHFQVQGIPAVKAFSHGEVVAEFVGAQPEARVRQFIEKLIPNEADLAFREANSLLLTRHWRDAEDAMRELLDEFPNYEPAKLALARALLMQGLGCEAQDYLKQIAGDRYAQAQTLLPLARYLCRVDSAVDEDLSLESIEMQYRQAGRLWQRGKIEAALDGWIDVLRQDKRYRKGEPKDVILSVFELLGEGDPLTQAYRSELAMVLF